MPAVFVHGNPETSEVWDGLRSELRRSATVAVSMPGFGCSRPDDFGSSKEEYVDWLVSELERLGEPVDLVGHDWGEDDFRAHRLRIGACPLAPDEAGGLASSPFTLAARPDQVSGAKLGGRSQITQSASHHHFEERNTRPGGDSLPSRGAKRRRSCDQCAELAEDDERDTVAR
jgi:hypothetical protein